MRRSLSLEYVRARRGRSDVVGGEATLPDDEVLRCVATVVRGGEAGDVRRLGELEAVLMDRLWSIDGSATVREVWEPLREERQIAYTTVMSTLDNLHRKGLVDRERDGRAYRYRPAASRAQYRAELMQQALGHDEDDAVLTHFIGQLEQDQLTRLQAVVRRITRRRSS